MRSLSTTPRLKARPSPYRFARTNEKVTTHDVGSHNDLLAEFHT
jgi:hypothetical protein